MGLMVSAKHNSPAGAVRNQEKWKYCDLYQGMKEPPVSVHKDYRREKVLLQLPSIPPCLCFSKQKLQLKLCRWPWLTQCLGTSSCFDLFAKKISLSSLERLSITVGQRGVPASREETSYLLSLPSHPVFRPLASSSGNKTRPAQLPVPTCHGMAQREIKHPARFLLLSLPPSGKFCQTYGFRKT